MFVNPNYEDWGGCCLKEEKAIVKKKARKLVYKHRKALKRLRKEKAGRGCKV